MRTMLVELEYDKGVLEFVGAENGNVSPHQSLLPSAKISPKLFLQSIPFFMPLCIEIIYVYAQMYIVDYITISSRLQSFWQKVKIALYEDGLL